MDVFPIAPPSQETEPPGSPGRFTRSSGPHRPARDSLGTQADRSVFGLSAPDRGTDSDQREPTSFQGLPSNRRAARVNVREHIRVQSGARPHPIVHLGAYPTAQSDEHNLVHHRQSLSIRQLVAAPPAARPRSSSTSLQYVKAESPSSCCVGKFSPTKTVFRLVVGHYREGVSPWTSTKGFYLVHRIPPLSRLFLARWKVISRIPTSSLKAGSRCRTWHAVNVGRVTPSTRPCREPMRDGEQGNILQFALLAARARESQFTDACLPTPQPPSRSPRRNRNRFGRIDPDSYCLSVSNASRIVGVLPSRRPRSASASQSHY